MRLRWPSAIVVGIVTVLLVGSVAGASHAPLSQDQVGTAPANSPVDSYAVTFNEAGLPDASKWNVTLNGSTDGVVGLIPVGPDPTGIFYDSVNGLLYNSISGDDRVAVIDPATATVLGSIPVGSDPRYIALDPTSGDLFVTNTYSDNVSIIDGASDTVLGSIPVGPNPIGIAFDPVNGELYVADSCVYCNDTSSNVSVIDTASDAVVRTIPVGSDARDIIYDPVDGRVYDADYNSGNVTVINTSSNSVVGSIYLGDGFSPSAPAVDTATGALYIVNNNWNGEIAEVNPTTYAVVQWVTLGDYPAHPYYDALNGYIYVANEFSDNVSVISTASNDVIGSIPAGSYPASMAIDTATDDVYVVNWQSNDIMVVNGSAPGGGVGFPTAPISLTNVTIGPSGSIQFSEPNGTYSYTVEAPASYVAAPSSGTIIVAGASASVQLEFSPAYTLTFEESGLPNGATWNVTLLENISSGVRGNFTVPAAPRGMLYDPQNGLLYVAGDGAQYVSVYNLTNDTVTRTIGVGFDPRYMALDPTTGNIFLTNTQSNNVSVINGSDNEVTGSIPVGQNPIGIVFDPSNGYLYVADSAVYGSPGEGANVTVIDAATETVVATVPVGTDARDLSLDPLNGLLYVANYGGGNLTVINTATQAVVGSVELGIGFAPTAPAVDPANGDLFVADNNWDGQVLVLNASTDAVLATIPVGFYPVHPFYDSENGYLYVGNEFSGNISVINPSNDTVVGSIPAGDYPATFALDTANDTLYVANWYSSNVVIVDGAAPLGGSVSLGPANYGSDTTAMGSGSITFYATPGTFFYTVGAPSGYVPSPAAGSVYVGPEGTTVYVSFSSNSSSNVTFTEKGGLPAGKSWTVVLNGESVSTTSRSISFHVPSGSYTYLITGPAGRRISGIPNTGTAIVNGTGPTASFTFVTATTYALTLKESGLPKGEWWCVTIGTELCSPRSSISVSHLPVGSYAYSIDPVAGQEINAKVGATAVPLSGSVQLTTRAVTISIKYSHPYPVTFEEVGLPSGTTWSVKVAGSEFSTTLSSFGYSLGNGTYALKVGTVPGYVHSASVTSVRVRGASVAVIVTFRPRSA